MSIQLSAKQHSDASPEFRTLAAKVKTDTPSPRFRIDPEAVPAELRERPQWLCWKYGPRRANGKRPKVPYDPKTGRKAASDDPSTWGTFEQALTAATTGNRYDGIGFVLTAADLYTVVDLDCCADGEGIITPQAEGIVSRLNSYTETSPGGDGLHIWAQAEKPPGWCRRDGVEMYGERQFMTITAQHYDGSPLTIEARQPEIDALHTATPAATDGAAGRETGAEPEEPEMAASGPELSDDALIERALAARNGEAFRNLWEGRWEGRYETQSEGDQALCAHFAFWTAKDRTRINTLFRRSGLYRDKWERAEYRESTIDLAVESTRNSYNPSRRDGAPAAPWSAPIEPETPETAEDALPDVEVLPFPADVFPPAVRRLIEEGSVALGCSPDLIGVPVLAVLGLGIGTQRAVQPKDGWKEFPSLYTATVAPPGSGKSPAQNIAVKPLVHAQQLLRTEHVASITAAAKARQEAKAKAAEAGPEPEPEAAGKKKKKKKDDKPEEEESEHGHARQLISTDATTESLALLLSENDHGIGYIQDELSALAGNFNRYRKGFGSDRQFYQSLWSSQPFVVHRMKQVEGMRCLETVEVKRPFISLIGGLQPDLLSSLSDERSREDGFCHRFLFSFPDAMPVQYSQAGISDEAQTAYQELVLKLLKLPVSLVEDGALRFTDKGQERWDFFMEGHTKELNDPLFPGYLRGPWMKLMAYGARFSLILHLAHWKVGDDPRPDDIAVLGAEALVDYFKSHARKVYQRLRREPGSQRTTRLLEWVAAHGGKVTARQVVKNNVASCKTSGDALELFERLAKARVGSVGTTTPARGGLATFYFEIGRRS